MPTHGIRSLLLVLTLAACCAVPLAAQTAPLPPGTVGVPYSFNFGEGFENFPGIPEFTFSFLFSAAGNVPPGLTMRSSGLLSGTPTQPGTFNFTINFGIHIEYLGQAFDFTYPQDYSITVGGGTGPSTSVEPRGITFVLTQSSSATQSISISNRGTSSASFSASAVTSTGGNWLSISPSGGAVPPFGSATIGITANAASLAPGTYSGTVTASLGNQSFSIPVIISVSGSQQGIQLTQSGLRFQAVVGGAQPPAQSFSVINSGTGSFPFDVAAVTVSGGNWLTATAASGTAASTPVPVSVRVNPSGLAPGNYYGTVQVSSSAVQNSPQVVSVVLNVVTPEQSPGAQATPTGLIFVGSQGAADVAAKTITLVNPSPRPLTFNAGISYENGANWLTVLPSTGILTASTTLNVQTKLAGLTAGVYKAEVAVRISEDLSIRRIAVVLIVLPLGSTPTGFAGPSDANKTPLATNCTPKRLVPVFTRLGAGFSATAAWPVTLEATVVDDCGTAMTAGNVVASFSSGDPSVNLTSLRDGRWTATWQPRMSAAQVTITVAAQQAMPALEGKEFIGGGLLPNNVTPSIAAGGALSAASYNPRIPLAPGDSIAIFGSNLSDGITQSPSFPLPMELNQTSALLGGRQLPLQFASNGQVNAIVPFDVPVNTTQQLIIQRGTTLSQPEAVLVAAAQPAVFTVDRSGKGPGIIDGFRSDRTPVEAGKAVSAGDIIVIYCSGLGAVDPAVPAGSAAPLDRLSSTVNPVSVTIGGLSAPVDFAGLAPGFTGLYQVNAKVPAGVAAGNAPVILTVAGQSSTPVTLPVQ